MVHHVVKINANAEPVRDLDQLEQFGLRPVTSGDTACLVDAAEIKGIIEIIADGEAAAGSFGGVREPETVVTRLGDFRHLLCDLVPGAIEEFQHLFRAERGGEEVEQHGRDHQLQAE